MELEKFISQSFIDISKWIIAAQNELSRTDAKINSNDADKLREIKFDIATVAEKVKEGRGKVSSKKVVVGLDLGGKISKTDSITGRISFTIPCVLPNAEKVTMNR